MAPVSVKQSRTGRESSSGKSTETQWTLEVTERLFGSAVCCASRLRKSISILQPHASDFNKTPAQPLIYHANNSDPFSRNRLLQSAL